MGFRLWPRRAYPFKGDIWGIQGYRGLYRVIWGLGLRVRGLYGVILGYHGGVYYPNNGESNGKEHGK